MTTSDSPSRLIGNRYRIERSIGSGGMGTVWAGRDELLDRDVAVKEVRFPTDVAESEQQDLRERTLREARATARLSHPNVVTTYDVVEEDGRPWIVMELLPSRSLGAVLREDGPMPPNEVADLGLAMLGALEVSHAQGIVHRDVKPGNVLITPDGRAVLTDFGIATMAGDPSLTSTGVVLGSPAYMSPERARGLRPGPEADMWSLGATLYAAAEGRPPYDSDSALATLTAVISDPVEPPTVDGPLREAILGLLAKEPGDRLDVATTRALLTRAAAVRSSAATPAPATGALDRAGRTEALALERHEQPAPAAEPAPPPAEEEYGGPPHASRDPGRRGPNGLAVAAVVLVLLLLGLGAIGLFASRGDDPTTTAQGAKAGQDPKKGKASSTPTKTTPSPSQSSSTPPSDTPSASSSGAGTAPAGSRTYRDQTGFSVAVPKGWQVSRPGTQVRFDDPGSLGYLLIDQTDQPKKNPKKDWERQEPSFAASHDSYDRISIKTVAYRDYPAADWQYTYATQTRAINRGFVAGDKGYAIYVSGAQGTWDQSQQVFQQAADTFQPAG